MEIQHHLAPTDPYEFGYGPRVMKEAKVCKNCGSTEKANQSICNCCGAQLPKQNLFQIYLMKHRRCDLCDTVLASYMNYCPHCGKSLKSD